MLLLFLLLLVLILLLLVLLLLHPLRQGQIVPRVVVVGVEPQGLFGAFDGLLRISFQQGADAGVVVCEFLQSLALQLLGRLVKRRLC
ncbi:MAG: hypothetical protein CL835_05195 [Crocinitomicaceae bacterium]|nr:hypothetical protein [Crocinitomicaceae bacterium]